MKVLLASPYYPPSNSGLGNAVFTQALMLKLAGHDVHIATAGALTSFRIDKSLGIIVHEFRINGADFLLNRISGDVDKYQEFLKNSAFDILIFNAWQAWSTDIAIKMLGKINGRKFVFSHGTSVNLILRSDLMRSIVRYILWRPYWWRMRRVLKNLDGIIFLSDSGVDSRFDDFKLASDLSLQYSIVPNALGTNSYEIFGLKPSNYSSRNGFISVGAYEWTKGHDFVIRSYAKSCFKNKVPLRIFGQKFTKYTNKLRLLAFSLGLQDSMIFFYEGVSGSELIKHYSSSVIFLYGSHTECQPLVLLDAMATGTPFISKASGCIPSMKGGISVTSEIECSLWINRLMGNLIEWQHYSHAGVSEALNRHHPDKVRDCFLRAINPA